MDIFKDKLLLFNIVINTNIEDLYTLYKTDQFIKQFLNEKYTLVAISEKYHLSAKVDNFTDIAWEYYVNKINILTYNNHKNTLSKVPKSLHIALLNYYTNNESVLMSEKPRTAYMFFANDQLDILRNEYPESNFLQSVTIIGNRWRELDENSKNYYNNAAIKDIFRYAKYLKNL